MPGVLDGVRVVEVSSTILGPLAGRLLAELGADVVKVEPLEGDIIRWMTAGRHPGMSGLFLHLNQGKRSLAVDLKRSEGREVLAAVVRDADVLLHNLRPDSAARLGLDYETLAPTHPRLIHCAATGFGPGPYRDRPAYDDVIQGMTGIAALQGIDRQDPEYVKTVLVDKTVAMAAVCAITAALYRRERTGSGQAVEVPMFETMVAFLLAEQLGGMTFEPPDGPPRHPPSVSKQRRPRRTSDGHISLVLYSDQHWTRFFQLIDREDLVDDPRFCDAAARSTNLDAAYAIVDEALAERPAAEWITRLEQVGIAAGPIRDIEDLFDDPHLLASGMLAIADHPSEGLIRHVGSPIRFSAAGGVATAPAPRLGEHSEEVLLATGMPRERIRSLAECGAVGLMEARIRHGAAQ